MQRSYLRLERRNTRFKMGAINQSEKDSTELKSTLLESKDVRKESVDVTNSFAGELVS